MPGVHDPSSRCAVNRTHTHSTQKYLSRRGGTRSDPRAHSGGPREMRPARIRIVGCPMKAPMIVNPMSVSLRPMPAGLPIASFDMPVGIPGGALDVTDGLVSIGQQAWMNGLATSVLH